MKINDTISGFRLIKVESSPENLAKINIFSHEKSGAMLCFIDREDRNLSFGISFYTPPKDSTGVFHIIEHSVLCGSKKYPVKEPFVELLKSSLNTFLNAMTYEDKTVYPVSSRCEKDFYNLVNVYLDAVFHPLMLTDPMIFEQEGHRLEYDGEEDCLSFNGVVFNEMQGVYSSPDELAGEELSRILFKGTPYGYDSGGAPDKILDLTYEDFCDSHKKYYHPSNSLLVLDGSVNLEKCLSLIDSYLSEYEGTRQEYRPISVEKKVTPTRKITYEAEEGDKPRLTLGFVFCDTKDKLSLQAAAVISDVLLGSNEAPLKQAMLSSGLCEDVSAYINRSSMATLIFDIYGIPEGREKEAEERLYSSIKEICNRGIEKELIEATLNRLKFRAREKDMGGYPKGIANILSVLEGWHYGIEPKELLEVEDSLSELSSLAETDFYEKTLEKMTVNCPHRAGLLLLPREEPSEISKRVEERLCELEKRLSAEEKEKIALRAEALAKKQTSPDSPEARATLPTLTLSDIEVKKNAPTTEISKKSGATILSHKVDIKGILYTELYFSVKDLTPREYTDLSILTSLLTNLDTEKYSAAEIKTKIKSSLGGFSPLAVCYSDVRSAAALPLLLVRLSSLTEKAEAGIELIGEVLLKTKLADKEKIKTILTQIRSATEATALASGDGVASERAEASATEAGRINEELMGITSYRRIKEYEEKFEELFPELLKSLEALVKKLFVKGRLTLAIAGDAAADYAERVVSLFPDGEESGERTSLERLSPKQGIKLPVRVGHSAMAFLSDRAREHLGALKVAGTILSFEYLWTEIRLRGGAYGAGIASRRYGEVIFSSYRDPRPQASVRTFMGAGRFLREFLADSPDLAGYIIGAVGDFDTLKTPRLEAIQATADYITGWSEEMDEKQLSDMLSCDKAALLSVAEMLEEETKSAAYAVVAGKEALSELDGAEIISPRE